MNKYQILALKSIRRVYQIVFNGEKEAKPKCIQDADVASKIIYDALMSHEPCMIARFGSTELTCLSNSIGVHKEKKQYVNYILGKSNPWWWEQNIIKQMQQWSGFFPAREDKIEQFCELMIQDISHVDVLASWLPNEKLFSKELSNSSKIEFELLNPYFSKIPWTKALEGKKVLVVHPFSNTIEQQYKKRELLFKDNLLPEFELLTIKAVQSIAGNTTEYNDWFEALDHMKTEMDNHDYDICLIGCGAYGFPLAAHAKRMGKKSIQMGGSLQLLFGIRGKRWEDSNYNPIYNYAKLMNEHWVKPGDEDKPAGAATVEGACYW
ncbi:hypothetical protein FQU23_007705 [Flavobacterium sp. XN-5]|uniref:GT-D fold domain-containing protein n=1 Tax=Flavobacterium sp. XN-5 TaxID=2599390 RepID=UPI0011C746B7|nr:hypothetical protein [Flavobacterium sp. XN-5]NGY37399.1 hypothetical protein [Flavobacterium sp. XN-5]